MVWKYGVKHFNALLYLFNISYIINSIVIQCNFLLESEFILFLASGTCLHWDINRALDIWGLGSEVIDGRPDFRLYFPRDYEILRRVRCMYLCHLMA